MQHLSLSYQTVRYVTLECQTHTIYRMNQEEIPILLEVMVSVIVRKPSYERVSNSEWLQRYSCLNLQT